MSDNQDNTMYMPVDSHDDYGNDSRQTFSYSALHKLALAYADMYEAQRKLLNTVNEDQRQKLITYIETSSFNKIQYSLSEKELHKVQQYYRENIAPGRIGRKKVDPLYEAVKKQNAYLQSVSDIHRTADNPTGGFHSYKTVKVIQPSRVYGDPTVFIEDWYEEVTKYVESPITFIDENKPTIRPYIKASDIIEKLKFPTADGGHSHLAQYSDSTVVFFDTETGKDKYGNDVPVSVAAVKARFNYKTKTYDIIDKEVRYYYDATGNTANVDVHGLHVDQVRYNRAHQGAKYNETYNEEEKQFWKEYLNSANVVQGHNIIDFDLPKALRITLDKRVSIIDTLTLARNRYGTGGNEQSKLFKKFYGMTPEEFGLPAHNALTDVFMNILISQALYKTKDPTRARKNKTKWRHSGVSYSMKYIMEHPAKEGELGFITAPYEEISDTFKSMIYQGPIWGWMSENTSSLDKDATVYNYEKQGYDFGVRASSLRDIRGKYIQIPDAIITGRALLLGEYMDSDITYDYVKTLQDRVEQLEAELKAIKGLTESNGGGWTGNNVSALVDSIKEIFTPTNTVLKDTAADLKHASGLIIPTLEKSAAAANGMSINNKMKAANFVTGLTAGPGRDALLEKLGFGYGGDDSIKNILELRDAERNKSKYFKAGLDILSEQGVTPITQYLLRKAGSVDKEQVDLAKTLWEARKESIIQKAQRKGQITEDQASELKAINSYYDLAKSLDEMAEATRRAAEATDLYNQKTASLHKALASIPFYDPFKIVNAQTNQVNGILSSLSSILPSWASAPVSRLANMYSLQIASKTEGIKNTVSGITNVVSPIASSMLTFGLATGNPIALAAGGIAGVLATGSQIGGNIATTKINKKGYDIQSNIQSIGFIVDYVAMPFRLLASVTKGLTHSFSSLSKGVINAARNIVNFASGLMTNGLNAIDVANPLSYLTGVGYSDYLGTTSIDMATLNSGGTMNGLIENLTSQSRLFNSLGVVDTNKLMAASMLGIGLGAYDSTFTGTASTYNLVDQIYARLQQYEGNETEQSKIMALAGMYDSNLPGILQAMKTWGVSSVSDLSNPSALTGQYWNPISNQSKLARTQYEWGVAQTQRSNGMQRLGMKVWDSFGKDFYDGINRVIDSIAGGDWPAALDSARKLWIDFKNEVVGIWDKLKTVFFGEEDVSIGDKIWSSIWTPIQNGIVKGLMWMSTTGIPLIADVWQSLTNAIIGKLAGVIGYISTIKIDVPGVLKALMNGDPLPEGWFQAGYGNQVIGTATKSEFLDDYGNSSFQSYLQWDNNAAAIQSVASQIGFIRDTDVGQYEDITGGQFDKAIDAYFGGSGYHKPITLDGKTFNDAASLKNYLHHVYYRDVAAGGLGRSVTTALQDINSTVIPWSTDILTDAVGSLAEGIAGGETTLRIIMETDTGKKVADIAVDAKGNFVNAFTNSLNDLKVRLNTLAERSVNLALEQRN